MTASGLPSDIFATAEAHPKGKGCWYFIHVWECVLCGSSEETRERREGPRPEHWGDRHDYDEGACGDHFV